MVDVQYRSFRKFSETPPEVADRAVSGHWEDDLIQCSKNSCIITLVERHSRFVMLAKIRDNKAITVISTLTRLSRELPAELYKTLTWDRGSNENTNRLFRQYFPKGTDLPVHSQQRLNWTVLHSSMKGREKRQTMNHPQNGSISVLRPSVELTAQSCLSCLLKKQA